MSLTLKQLIKAGFSTRQSKVLQGLVPPPIGVDELNGPFDKTVIGFDGWYHTDRTTKIGTGTSETGYLLGPTTPLAAGGKFEFQHSSWAGYDGVTWADDTWPDVDFLFTIHKVADASGVPIAGVEVVGNVIIQRRNGVISLTPHNAPLNGWTLEGPYNPDYPYGFKAAAPAAGWYYAFVNASVI